MSLIFYLTFILLIFIVTYYFIYLENLNHDNLFYIILNFIFLIILPLYYLYFEDLTYSLIISFMLFYQALYLTQIIVFQGGGIFQNSYFSSSIG